MYYIIKYTTHKGGGVAFVSNEISKDEAIFYVRQSIKHNWKVEDVQIIGETNHIELSALKKKTDFEYEHCDEDKCIYNYYDIEMDNPVYYYGGDCC